jgi:membrane protein implicated in regulation of membrane protease activity
MKKNIFICLYSLFVGIHSYAMLSQFSNVKWEMQHYAFFIYPLISMLIVWTCFRPINKNLKK